MSLSNSVIRRYTPPTCTLEVLAQSSPLSHWMGKTVIKQLSFELRFDDPRLPEERRFVIRGDRNQLEALCDAVTSYVQGFLQQSSESFCLGFSSPQDSTRASLEFSDIDQSVSSPQTVKSDIPSAKIYLEPSSHLTHKLYLGSLAGQVSSPYIQLSLLQLFDLATALDEYSADVLALPDLNTTRTVLPFPAWTPVAAVLLLSVGVLPITLQYANQYRTKQQPIAQVSLSPQPENAPENAIASSSSSNLSVPLPALTPPDNLPPSIDPTLPLPISSFPAQPVISPSGNLAAKLPTSGNNLLNTPQTAINPNINPASTPIPGQQIALNPKFNLNPPQPITKGELATLQKRNLTPRLASRVGNLSSSTTPIIPPPLATIPNQNPGNNFPAGYSPTNQELAEKTNSSIPPSAADNNPFVDRLGDNPKNLTSTNVATNSTIFDTTQIAEARSFFQKRWQPPSGLTQTLEYSLILGVNGSIERILPLNKPAREFIDNTGIPAIGKPFVSANRAGQNLRIRAVFSPDGKVQTFSESE